MLILWILLGVSIVIFLVFILFLWQRRRVIQAYKDALPVTTVLQGSDTDIIEGTRYREVLRDRSINGLIRMGEEAPYWLEALQSQFSTIDDAKWWYYQRDITSRMDDTVLVQHLGFAMYGIPAETTFHPDGIIVQSYNMDERE